MIPLNNSTYQFCWRLSYIGIIVDVNNVKEEVNEDNNIGYYAVIFDCGGIVETIQ